MKFEVPQRRQLASEKTSLTLFAPAPSTISFVPLTRNLSLADPSPYPVRGWTGLSAATATRFPVLRATKCDAFSEARRTKNRLLRYGIRIRCSKRLPPVRDAFSEAFGVKNRLFRYGMRHSVTKKGSWGTRCVFKGAQNSTCYIERILKGPQNSRLHRLWTASCRSGSRFSARNAHRSEVSKYKKRMTSKPIKTF